MDNPCIIGVHLRDGMKILRFATVGLLMICAGIVAAQQCEWHLDEEHSFDIAFEDETTLIFGECNMTGKPVTFYYDAGSETRTWSIIVDVQKEIDAQCQATINWDPLLDPPAPRDHTASWPDTEVTIAPATWYTIFVLWHGKNLQQVWDSYVENVIIDIGIERAGGIFYEFEIAEKTGSTQGVPWEPR